MRNLGIQSNKLIFYTANVLSWFLVFLIPVDQALMFIVLIFALSGWALGTWPQPVVSLGILLYLEIVGIFPFENGLQGYAQPFVWLLVSTFIIAAGFEKTGLGRRIALEIFSLVKGNASASIGVVIVSLTVLGFLIPTGAGRIAIILPVCTGLIEVVKNNGEGSSYAKSVLLAVTFTSAFMSFAVITGSSSSVYAASMIQLTTGFSWSYLHWLIVHGPIALIMLTMLCIILMWKYPMKKGDWIEGRVYIQKKLEEMGSISLEERKLFLLSILMLGAWITEPIHGYSVATTAMIAALLTCLPVIGIQNWKHASISINWDIIILFGAAYALADAMQSNGTADWIAQGLINYIPPGRPLITAIIMILIVSLFRLGFANMLGITAVFLPITISLADALSLNSIWLAQIVIISCSIGYFLPSQSPSNLMTFAMGEYTKADLSIVGTVLFLIIVPVILLLGFFYWPLVGLQPN
ncbi:DASS family sodium-coupled anion symporter [Virgibacillus sp. NKC19-16]|uniref:SLC13 family permease n=1 Tax=Virgibacillus salidurans TaxID=2831673 RepID=UPI001F2BF61C|nr:DASS family sodium-coupled anion symporter [Virgibacillus sp. NKC19-16]UJL45559.1 DASS family sodium-coupled anion symporter [Virgibacillus sp. NKC19-16]